MTQHESIDFDSPKAREQAKRDFWHTINAGHGVRNWWQAIDLYNFVYADFTDTEDTHGFGA